MIQSLALSIAFLFLAGAPQKLDIRKPTLDSEGRMWLYHNSKDKMPFIPYGWMPAEAAGMMKTDPGYADNTLAKDKTCFKVDITWQSPNWCGVAWISGPSGAPGDGEPWWGEDKQGWYFDLSHLKHKKLVFSARGRSGGEKIQIKFAILGDKKFGDSMPFAAATDWIELSKSYKQYTLDLSSYSAANLSKICNGFTFVSNADQQEGKNQTKMTFYLKSIYLK